MTTTSASNLTIEQIQSIIRLAEKRDVLLESDGGNLRVRGEPAAIALLRPHLTKAKTAIVEYLQANPQQNLSPMAIQNERGQGERGKQTTLDYLSRLGLKQIPGATYTLTEADIDLALWLIAATILHSNPTYDAGIVIDVEGRPVNVAETVAALARGKQQNETPAAWLERISKLKALLGQSFKWRASTGYRSVDWPAELKRAPRPAIVAAPPKANPVEKKKSNAEVDAEELTTT